MGVLRGRVGTLPLSRRCANLFRAGGITKERVSLKKRNSWDNQWEKLQEYYNIQ